MDRGIAHGLAPRRDAQLAAVWRDHRRAAINRVVWRLGIDDDRNARALGSVDHRADDARRQHALGVVGEHDCADARQRPEGARDQFALTIGVDGRGMFPIRAQQMRREMFADESHFPRRRACTIDDQ